MVSGPLHLVVGKWRGTMGGGSGSWRALSAKLGGLGPFPIGNGEPLKVFGNE